MQELVLYKDDFKSTSMWHHVLDMVGVETHTTVAGKVIDKDVEMVTILVHSASEIPYAYISNYADLNGK